MSPTHVPHTALQVTGRPMACRTRFGHQYPHDVGRNRQESKTASRYLLANRKPPIRLVDRRHGIPTARGNAPPPPLSSANSLPNALRPWGAGAPRISWSQPCRQALADTPFA